MALSGIYPVTLAQARFEETYTSLTTDKSFPGFALGDVCIDNLGGQWIFVRAAETLTAHSVCVVTNASLAAGTYLAEMVEAADIATGPKVLGVNQVEIAANSYGWLHRGPGGGFGKGCKVRAANATAGALLHPLAATPGAVDDANVDEGVLAGLQILATVTTIAATEYQLTTILSCNLTEAD
jgi:hypothetical protein